MAEFNGGEVVLVPLPVAPEMVVWALPGPAGDIPYADVEALVDAEFDDRIDTMTTLESSTVQASEAATTAAGTATTAASEAVTARGEAVDAADTATTSAGSAVTAAGTATEAADTAEQYALEFDLDVSSTTGAPGSQASATVTGDGPAYQINLVIPEGAKGAKGDNGEITQEELDTAIASLVDNAPEALDTLTELAAALGNDPNFATTTATEIGKRVLIDGAPAEYNTLGKLVLALQNHELGGSTDASVLEGALSDQVDASAATIEYYSVVSGLTSTLRVGKMGEQILVEMGEALGPALEGKSDVGHTHTWTQISDAPAYSKDMTGDHLVQRAANGHINVPPGAGPQNPPQRSEVDAAINAKIRLVTEFPSSSTPGVLYLKAE